MKLILILLIAVFSTAETVCSKYVKNDSIGEACIQVANTTTYLKPCTDAEKTFCNPTTNNCEKPKPHESWPGEYCDGKDYICKDGLGCPASKCIGKKLTDTCAKDADCNPGLYCNLTRGNNTCQATGLIDAVCDPAKNESRKCEPGTMCNTDKCVKIGSQPEGTTVVSPILCTSQVVDKDNKCIKGLRYNDSNAKEPFKCDDKLKPCVYSDNSTGVCDCGYTADGSKYCPAKAGLLDFADYYKYAEMVYNKGTHHVSCGIGCLTEKSMPIEFHKMVIVTSKLDRWHKFVDNTEEVKKIYTGGYWKSYDIVNAKKDDDKFMLYLIIGISAGVVLIVTVLAVVLLMKKCKSSDTETGNLMEGDT